MLNTIYVCSKCGETTADWENTDDWLIGSAKLKPGEIVSKGEMVIRCPEHVTRYAIYKAGGHLQDGKGIVNRWAYELSA